MIEEFGLFVALAKDRKLGSKSLEVFDVEKATLLWTLPLRSTAYSMGNPWMSLGENGIVIWIIVPMHTYCFGVTQKRLYVKWPSDNPDNGAFSFSEDPPCKGFQHLELELLPQHPLYHRDHHHHDHWDSWGAWWDTERMRVFTMKLLEEGECVEKRFYLNAGWDTHTTVLTKDGFAVAGNSSLCFYSYRT